MKKKIVLLFGLFALQISVPMYSMESLQKPLAIGIAVLSFASCVDNVYKVVSKQRSKKQINKNNATEKNVEQRDSKKKDFNFVSALARSTIMIPGVLAVASVLNLISLLSSSNNVSKQQIKDDTRLKKGIVSSVAESSTLASSGGVVLQPVIPGPNRIVSSGSGIPVVSAPALSSGQLSEPGHIPPPPPLPASKVVPPPPPPLPAMSGQNKGALKKNTAPKASDLKKSTLQEVNPKSVNPQAAQANAVIAQIIISFKRRNNINGIDALTNEQLKVLFENRDIPAGKGTIAELTPLQTQQYAEFAKTTK